MNETLQRISQQICHFCGKIFHYRYQMYINTITTIEVL